MAGADLVTACQAILAPGGTNFLPEVGISPAVAVELPAVARKLVAEARPLMLVQTRVESSPPVLIVARQLITPLQHRALDVLLDIAAQYIANHEQNLEQFLWQSSVLSRLRSPTADEPPGLVAGARSSLLMAVKAWDAGLLVVNDILQTADRKGASPVQADGNDLETLGTMIGRRVFLGLMRRIRRSLADDELEQFVDWASRCAGQQLRLPDT